MITPSARAVFDKETWEKFIHTQPEANFLQSWNWGVFHQNIGHRIHRIGYFYQGEMVGAAELIIEDAKRGRYMAIYGGPLWDWSLSRAELMDMLGELKRIAKREGCVFIRMRPQERDSIELRKKAGRLGFKKSPMHLTADLTLQLDLKQSGDDLLAQMRKNTRYYVRRAFRDGVEVEVSNNPDDIEEFYNYQIYLAEKHNFVPFSYNFLHEQFKAFAADNQASLLHAKLDSELLASAFVIFYNKEAVYHYGISTPENDDVPGSYAVLWKAIEEAQKRGCTRFNFWGIAPKGAEDHRFYGVSRFKRGFGGEEVPYLPAMDLPITSWRYKLTRLFESVRAQIRGL